MISVRNPKAYSPLNLKFLGLKSGVEMSFQLLNKLKVKRLSKKVTRRDYRKKSRRMINTETSLVQTIRFADCVVSNHFNDIIEKPHSPIPNRFPRNVAEHAAKAKYIISVADSSKANNITMYRILCILSKAALKLDDTDDRLYEDILSNPFIG